MKSCEHIDKVPIYAKMICGIAIDPSEFTHPDGAVIAENEVRCRLVADEGHKFCPRHELINSLEAKEVSA